MRTTTVNRPLRIKSVEVEGLKVEMLSEHGGALFRVNVTFNGAPVVSRTSDTFAAASEAYDAHARGH